jgi:hypothetical protein
MKRRTKSEWLSLIADFEISSQSQATFCEERAINPNYFSLRRSQLRAETSSEFVRAMPAASVHESDPIILRYGNVGIQFGAGVSVATLVELVKALA